MSEMKIERLTTYDQFLFLKDEWDVLAIHSVPTIFLTHSWLDHWWQIYGDELDLWILVVRENTIVLGLLPLVLKHGPLGSRQLLFMGAGEVTPNHLNIICNQERFLEVAKLICNYLIGSISEWDVLELDKLPSEHIALDFLQSEFKNRGLPVRLSVIASCPYVILPETFDLYLQSLGSSTRAAYRRVKRYIERDFPDMYFGCVQSEVELAEVFEELVKLHQERWVKRGYPGAFAGTRLAEFHRAVSLDTFKSGLLRMYYLKVSEKLVAIYYCFLIGGHLQYYIGGFNDRLSKYSPGMLITGYSIERSIHENADFFDFLEGDEGYKSHWASGVRENKRLVVFSPGFRGRFIHFYVKVKEGIIRIGIRFIPLAIRRPLRLALQRWLTQKV